MLIDTPSLRARHAEKQLQWRELLAPEVARRIGADPHEATDPRAGAIVVAALSCYDATHEAWIAANGAHTMPELINKAMAAVNPPTTQIS